jgi:hypothetical protein
VVVSSVRFFRLRNGVEIRSRPPTSAPARSACARTSPVW